MKEKIKIIIMLLLCVLTVSLSSATVYALCHEDSYYDAISWTWEYSAPATRDYNCLGYATGSMTWEWPWSGKPTDSEVTAYLEDKGYSTSGKWAYIISYGSSSEIKHFSKVTGTSWCRAKWGRLERFNHGSWDPYVHEGVYGPQVTIYYQ